MLTLQLQLVSFQSALSPQSRKTKREERQVVVHSVFVGEGFAQDLMMEAVITHSNYGSYGEGPSCCFHLHRQDLPSPQKYLGDGVFLLSQFSFLGLSL